MPTTRKQTQTKLYWPPPDEPTRSSRKEQPQQQQQQQQAGPKQTPSSSSANTAAAPQQPPPPPPPKQQQSTVTTVTTRASASQAIPSPQPPAVATATPPARTTPSTCRRAPASTSKKNNASSGPASRTRQATASAAAAVSASVSPPPPSPVAPVTDSFESDSGIPSSAASTASWSRRFRAWQTQNHELLPPSVPPSESHQSQEQQQHGGRQRGGSQKRTAVVESDVVDEEEEEQEDVYEDTEYTLEMEYPGTDVEGHYPETVGDDESVLRHLDSRDDDHGQDEDEAEDDLFSDAWSVQHEIDQFDGTVPVSEEGDINDTFNDNDDDDATTTNTASDQGNPRSSSPALSASSFGSFPELHNLTIDDVTGDIVGLDIPMSQLTLSDTCMPDVAVANKSSLEPPMALQDRLALVWPKLPPGLAGAPLAISWEVTRAAIHCGVDLDAAKLHYDPAWLEQERLWAHLRSHPAFRAGTAPLPEKCDPLAWRAALQTNFQSGHNATILAAEIHMLKQRPRKDAAPVRLELQPLHLEQSCRLYRRFGADRFVELLFPSSKSWTGVLKRDGGEEAVVAWLTDRIHSFMGRQWASFWTEDGGRKDPIRDIIMGPEPRPIFKDRIYLFAERGARLGPNRLVISRTMVAPVRAACKREVMLDWLLNFDHNKSKTLLKLFSRVKLGLSKTAPVVVLEESQITHRPSDMISPEKGTVMNDGIGRMSLCLMKKVRDELALMDLPSAIQGRLGSAKGMWIIDNTRPTDEIWIETYPSQEKWECDWTDPAHRTLEVCSWSSELRSASLNLQFLPILEDRSPDKELVRSVIRGHLQGELSRDLESLKKGLERPEMFRQWLFENSLGSMQIASDDTPWLGGLPDREDDVMAFLLDGGFEPTRLKFFWDMVVRRQRHKCERLQQKMNVKIGQSAYVYMVVDFSGVLKEDEVHMCFSSRFQDDAGEFADTMLDGFDVLVARAPAHLPSDIQRVRAVFKPELRHLRDVIVFPATGEVPLAHKLSGGDYDGDRAWVCWDQRLVKNFDGVDLPPEPDLSQFYTEDKTKFSDKQEVPHRTEEAVVAMIREGFAFSMKQNYLGILTSWKEKFAYRHNSVSSDETVMLAYMLSKLVDQAKQGTIFTERHFRLIREAVGEKYQIHKPLYKGNGKREEFGPHTHIIDHLRFDVAEKTIKAELDRLDGTVAYKAPLDWDTDLTVLHNNFEQLAKSPEGRAAGLWGILVKLRSDINSCAKLWRSSMSTRSASGSDSGLFRSSFCAVFDKWRAIQPAEEVPRAMPTLALLQGLVPKGELSDWELLKASATFKIYGNSPNQGGMPKFAWRMAGMQLQQLKAMAMTQHMRPEERRTMAAGQAASAGAFELNGGENSQVVWSQDGESTMDYDETMTTMNGGGAADVSNVTTPAERLVLVRGGRAPVMVLPGIYHALRPDGKKIRQMTAARDEERMRMMGDDDDDDGQWST